jgi:YD repeat-containing protein
MTYVLTNHQYQCTEIKDRNGNFITVAYDSRGHITTITDTLARVISFNYDGLQSLTSITQPGHTWASFDYATQTINTDFGTSLAMTGPAASTLLSVLSKVTLDDGLSANFDYTSWGQVHKIRTLAAADDHLLNYVSYDLPLDAAATQTDCPRFTQRKQMAENWNNGDEVVAASYSTFDPNGDSTETTTPDGTLYKEYFFTSVSDYRRGLTSEAQVWAGTPSVQKKKTVITWTQDDTGVAYQLNPRVTETNVDDDADNRRRTTISYTSAFNLPWDVREYAADGTTLLRRTHTDYDLSSTYVDKRIIGLPSAVKLYSGESESTLLSNIEFLYDSTATGFLVDPGTIAQHVNVGYTLGGGNLTNHRRFHVTDPTSLTKAVNYKTGYNMAGSVIFVEDPLEHRSSISYSDSFSDNVNRNTFAYPTTLTDPDLKSLSVQYDFGLGRAKVTTDPKGATLTRTFDSAGRITRIESNSTAYTRFVYPSNMTEVDTYVSQSLSPTTVEIYSAQFFDGAGRVIATRRALPGSTGGNSGQKFVYDLIGRLSQQSNPTEVTSAGVPTGDDAAGWLYSRQDYDWKGRPTVATNSDQTTRETSYGGCGCAGGEVVTIRDEVSRRQRVTYDVLGRLVTTESLNWDQSVYSTTKNTYNARDQVTLVRQYQGTESSGTYQDTVMTYDGHGRLWTQKAPVESTSTKFEYYEDDTLNKRTDPRGASATFTYNARHLVETIIYAKPVGSALAPQAPNEITAIPLTPPVGFDYDAAGNRLWMTDGQGRTDYAYDTWSRLGTETRQFNAVTGSWQLQYAYNLAGELTSLTDAFGQKVDYGYNQAGELLTVKIGNVNYASGMLLRAWGAPKQIDLGNNLRETMSYNTRLQATQYEMHQGGGNGALILGFQYSYDFDGQVSNLNDGRVRLAHDLTATNSTMERSFSYDQAARLTSARSGSEAIGQVGIPTGPFQHTYGFDAFENMTTRGGRNGYAGVTSQPINYNATYVNDRNQAWSYNDSGNVVIADQQQYQWDTAGQMARAQTMNLYLYRDGDGQDVLRTLDGVDTYYIRSSLLGGVVVGEMNVNGGNRRTFVYANGRRIARQKNGNTYWLSQDPANVTNIETDISGAIWARAQLDPLGVLTGTGQSVIPQGGSFNTTGYYGNAGSPGDGCRLDGAPMPCDWVARLVNAGNSLQCPNNDCGPIPIRDSRGNPTGGFESFRATANGRSGWLPINAIFYGSDNGSWHYPGSDFGGSLSNNRDAQDPTGRPTAPLPSAQDVHSNDIASAYDECKDRLGSVAPIATWWDKTQNKWRSAPYDIVPGLQATAFVLAAVDYAFQSSPRTAAVIAAEWAFETKFQLYPDYPDSGPMQLTGQWAWMATSNAYGSRKNHQPFNGDPLHNIIMGGRVLAYIADVDFGGDIRRAPNGYGPGRRPGQNNTERVARSNYEKTIRNLYERYRGFFKCLAKARKEQAQ